MIVGAPGRILKDLESLLSESIPSTETDAAARQFIAAGDAWLDAAPDERRGLPVDMSDH
jgi:hypothetical protein